METLEMNRSNFLKSLSRSDIVVVDCWAAWCGACQQFSTVVEKVAARYPDYLFAKLDTDSETSLSYELGIKEIPTLIVFRDGVPVFCQPGSYTEGGLVDIVEQARALDMEIVKHEMAASRTAEDETEVGQEAHGCH